MHNSLLGISIEGIGDQDHCKRSTREEKKNIWGELWVLTEASNKAIQKQCPWHIQAYRHTGMHGTLIPCLWHINGSQYHGQQRKIDFRL